MREPSDDKAPRLFDCFTFFNELDILELRLAELDGVVDQFVIAEGTKTFRGDTKPLHFEKNARRFQGYLPKIKHVVIDDFPAGCRSAWDREHWSRQALVRGLQDAAPDDYTMVSDVDEIPRPERLSHWITQDRLGRGVLIMETEAFYYSLNVRPVGRRLSTVQAPRIVKRRFLKDPQQLRGFRARVSKSRSYGPLDQLILRARAVAAFGAPLEVVVDRNAGWHFTYISSPELIRLKLLSYSHEERCDAKTIDVENIAQRIGTDRWLFDDSTRLEAIPIGATFPAAIRNDLERWRPLIRPVEGRAVQSVVRAEPAAH
jgi:beta-1,4-mannosyl-glycoprotein beta-1,4-N-acetylglucosaminyltransferase